MENDLNDLVSIIGTLPSGLADESNLQKIRQSVLSYSVEFSAYNLHTIFLSKLAHKLFENSKLPPCKELLLFITLKGHPDVWFDQLLVRLGKNDPNPDNTQLCIDLISKFIIEYNRLPQLFSAFNDLSNSFTPFARQKFLVDKIRGVVNLPTLLSNAFGTARLPKLFKPDVYCPFLMRLGSSVECKLISGLILSQSCFLGFGRQCWLTILRQVARSEETSIVWGSVISHINERFLEPTVVSLLNVASHPHLVTICLSSLLCPPTEEQLFRLFSRVLLFKQFSSPLILVNLFGFLREVATDDLVKKVEKELGLPVLRCWSDALALKGTPSEKRIFLNQSLVVWVNVFQDSIRRSPSYADITSLVLQGISTHLSCNIEEQRVLGMAVGEWLLDRLQVGCSGSCKEEALSDECPPCLKFEYDENEATKRVKPLFEPFPPYQSPDSSADVDVEDLFEPTPELKPHSVMESDTELDSDDDPDEEDDDPSLAAFKPLPKYVNPASSEWPYRARRPHYLRECLDGLTGVKHNADDVASNEVALSCFAHAEELIYRYRGGAVDEVAASFADTLLHTEPPASPCTDKVNASRHNALVALAVTSPRRTARYLTGQLLHPGLAVNQHHAVIAALTDAACRMGTDFTPVAGEFFFPTLRAVDALIKRRADVYAHLDEGILARLLASLGTMYSLASSSPKLARMAEGLLALGKVLLTPEHDPIVRRSLLTTLNVVLAATPMAVFRANQHLMDGFNLMVSLTRTVRHDPDTECQKLALSAISSFKTNLVELLGGGINGLHLTE